MIICTKCGFQNDDTDTFCGSCAAFLEWSGEKQKVEEPEPVPAEPEPEEVPVEHGLFERVKERIVGVGEARTTSTPATPTVDVSETESEPAPAVVGAAAAAGDRTGSLAVGGGADIAASTTIAPALTTAPVVTTAPVTTVPVTTAPVTGAPVTAAPLTGAPGPTTGVPGPEMRVTAAGPVDTPTRTPEARSAPASQPAPGAPASKPATPVSTVQSPPAPGQAAGSSATVAPSASATAAPAPAAPKSPAPAAPVQPAAAAPAPVQPSVTSPVAPVQPEAVKPASARARPANRPKQPSERVINPGDKVCGQCGEGNDPARRFCRRCGASLEQAVVFTPPWYRRLIHRLRKRKVRAAGERPKLRRRAFGGAGGGWISSWVTKLIALAVIAFVVITFVGPWKHTIRHRLSTWYHDVKNAVHTTYNPVHPVGATATSAVSGHPAGNAIDDASNTSWQAAGSRSGLGETLTMTLQVPANIDKIGFLNGDQDTPQAYLTEPRPETVLVTFNGSTASSRSISLKDSASFQSFTVDAKKATSLTVTIESVYASSQGQNASIAEVELFTKS